MDAYTALADPTRRTIIEMLAQAEQSAGEIAAEFSVTRPAISRHLRVLRESGIVKVSEQGQQRIYRLHPESLDEVRLWIERYSRFWEERIEQLVEFVEERTNEGETQ